VVSNVRISWMRLVRLVPEECASFGKRVDEVEETEGGIRLRFR